MIRALLVDDEDLARKRLRRLLSVFKSVSVVGEASDGEEALGRVRELSPDVIFLDVQMPGSGGFDVVRSLATPLPKIVFCTGYDRYAVQAFDVHAVDYLLKPVTRARLSLAIERITSALGPGWESAVEEIASRSAGPARFLARLGSRYRVVAEADVEYLDSQQGVSAIHTEGEQFWLDPSLNSLEERLDPGAFFRISRAAIVRLDSVLEVYTLMGGHGEVRLRSGARLVVSRRRFQALLSRLGGRR